MKTTTTTDSVKFNLGDLVRQIIRPGMHGMVTAITFNPAGAYYSITWDDGSVKTHYEIELEPDERPASAP